MYFPFLKLQKCAKDPLRSADAIVRCCLNTEAKTSAAHRTAFQAIGFFVTSGILQCTV